MRKKIAYFGRKSIFNDSSFEKLQNLISVFAQPKSPSRNDRKIARLSAQLKRKAMEVEILRKAFKERTAFFYKES